MNWDTQEVYLIVTNTEGIYIDLRNGVYIGDIVDGLRDSLFSHVNIDVVDIKALHERLFDIV